MTPRPTIDDQPFEEGLEHTKPACWHGRKPNGILPPWELEAMANADCRFLDPVTRELLPPGVDPGPG